MKRKCKRCSKEKDIIGFGYCRECAIKDGAKLKDNWEKLYSPKIKIRRKG